MSQITVPNPRTWTALDQVLVPRLRADVSDAVALLSNRPYFLGQMSTGASTTSGTDAPMALTSELADTWNGHNTASGNWQWYYCQLPGWYLCRGWAPFAYTTATQIPFAAGIVAVTGGVTQTVVRGPIQQMGSGKHPGPKVCDLVQMSNVGAIGGSGDAVEMTALQISGGSLSYVATPATLLPYFSARWVSALSGTAGLPIPSSPSWPSPITASWMNTNIRDAIRFLIYPPICKAYYVAGSSSLPSQAFPAGTVVNLTNTLMDNYGGYTTGPGGGYTAPVNGNYFVAGQINLASYGTTAAVAYSCGLSVNGGTIAWGDSVFENTLNTSGSGASVERRIRLNAGDTVQLMAQQSTSGALSYNATPSNQTRMIVVWEGQ